MVPGVGLARTDRAGGGVHVRACDDRASGEQDGQGLEHGIGTVRSEDIGREEGSRGSHELRALAESVELRLQVWSHEKNVHLGERVIEAGEGLRAELGSNAALLGARSQPVGQERARRACTADDQDCSHLVRLLASGS